MEKLSKFKTDESIKEEIGKMEEKLGIKRAKIKRTPERQARLEEIVKKIENDTATDEDVWEYGDLIIGL